MKENKKQNVIILVGASGSGKTTLANRMVDDMLANKAITCTTRRPRVGEVDGIHYHFVSKEKMFDLAKNNELIEEPNHHAGNYYGCPISSLRGDKPVIVIVDINGAKEINKRLGGSDEFNLINVCIEAPSKSVLMKRFVKDGRRAEEIESRLKVYENEKGWSKEMDFDLVLSADKEIKDVNEQMNLFINEVLGWIKTSSQEMKKELRAKKRKP